MTIEEIVEAGAQLIASLPPPVRAAVSDVRIEAVASPTDPEVLLLLTEEDLELELDEIVDDARGLYVGSIPEPTDDESDDGEPPSGLILLFASNLPDPDTVKLTLAHEIGHALGLDETEVEALGLI